MLMLNNFLERITEHFPAWEVYEIEDGIAEIRVSEVMRIYIHEFGVLFMRKQADDTWMQKGPLFFFCDLVVNIRGLWAMFARRKDFNLSTGRNFTGSEVEASDTTSGDVVTGRLTYADFSGRDSNYQLSVDAKPGVFSAKTFLVRLLNQFGIDTFSYRFSVC